MASNGYTRQSTFSNGDVVDDFLFNNEYDQLALSFHATNGHTHDGTTGQGAPVPLIKDITTTTSVEAGTDVIVMTISGSPVFTFSPNGTLNGLDVNSVQSQLDNLASATHIHAISDVTGLQTQLDNKASATHIHAISDVTGLQTQLADINTAIASNPGAGGTVDWSSIVNEPAFTTRWPTWTEVTSKPDFATRWPTWTEVTSKPTTFTPTSHTHLLSEITDYVAPSITSFIDNPASSTITRNGSMTYVLVDTTAARTFTLDESTFLIGDLVEIDVIREGTAGVTVTTDTGVIYLPDGTSGASHVLTGDNGVIRLYKHSSTDWRLRVYN